jgi:hypothetical protein
MLSSISVGQALVDHKLEVKQEEWLMGGHNN